MSTLKVDLDLVQKYNVAGPRYTSYPPATKFSSALGWDDLASHLEANNRSARSRQYSPSSSSPSPVARLPTMKQSVAVVAEMD